MIKKNIETEQAADALQQAIDRISKLKEVTNITAEDKLSGMEKHPKWVKYGLYTRIYRNKVILARMELNNGQHRTLIVKGSPDGFVYQGGRYILDPELKYYDLDLKCWCYDFHQDYALPIDRKIPIQKIKNIIMQPKVTEISYASNPSVLQRFMIAKVAEGIMRGQQIDEFLRSSRIIWIIAAGSSLLLLILFVWKTGMLQQIHLPF